MPLNKFIETINAPFEKLISEIKVYGIAEPVTRTRGSAVETLPGIVGNDGEVTYVGPDDLRKLIIYHKANAIGTTLSTRKGTGNDPNPTVNAYSLSMIVWLDRKKTDLRPDEIFLLLQANMPFEIRQSPYDQVLVKINSVILNGQQVFDSEFKGFNNKLPANQSMLQINYTIESTFKLNCFAKCPEDC